MPYIVLRTDPVGDVEEDSSHRTKKAALRRVRVNKRKFGTAWNWRIRHVRNAETDASLRQE
jgi:hypothetical protein